VNVGNGTVVPAKSGEALTVAKGTSVGLVSTGVSQVGIRVKGGAVAMSAVGMTSTVTSLDTWTTTWLLWTWLCRESKIAPKTVKAETAVASNGPTSGRQLACFRFVSPLGAVFTACSP
jgi:hypothetical protein